VLRFIGYTGVLLGLVAAHSPLATGSRSCGGAASKQWLCSKLMNAGSICLAWLLKLHKAHARRQGAAVLTSLAPQDAAEQQCISCRASVSMLQADQAPQAVLVNVL
jgi:hypothetical protein